MSVFFDREAVTKECSRLLEKGEINVNEMDRQYLLFHKRFSLDVLRSLDGVELIETMFDVMNRDGLAYWLEFKKDEMFSTKQFGSIAGGSALKYIIYKRAGDHNWMTGSPNKQTVLPISVAVEKGRKIRDAILRGADLISKMDHPGIEEYVALQECLDNDPDYKIGIYGWIHKYYHMLFPNLFATYHSYKYLRHYLFACEEKPSEHLYVMSGQLVKVASEFGFPLYGVMSAMANLYGTPIGYYRVGTRDGQKSCWPEMLNGNHISIGWPALGDLDSYNLSGKGALKGELQPIYEKHYQSTPQMMSRKLNEILSFYFEIRKSDIIVAVDGEIILGIGRVTGEYEYQGDLYFPHTREVEWIYTGRARLPNPKEGLRTSVTPYRDSGNILEIRALLAGAAPKKKPNGSPAERHLQPLEGIPKKIEGILERKKQVILYGPPGTGKTYHAEKTAQELASRNIYKKTFGMLTADERKTILGDGRSSGYVRVCCFHASYGYEDFIEGIKPRTVDGRTLFELRDGLFKILCADAAGSPDKSFFLVIDEINRGDMSRIFGELMMLMEAGKRGKLLLLPVSGEPFCIPHNVYIIGTMNTADSSIALLDVALRRRFGFHELMPDYDLLEGVSFEGLPLSEWLRRLNERICRHIGKDARNMQIGHSYFMEGEKPITSGDKLRQILAEDVVPLIEEYCYGDYEMLSSVLGTVLVDAKNRVVQRQLFEGDFSELVNALLQPCPGICTEPAEDERIDGSQNDDADPVEDNEQ